MLDDDLFDEPTLKVLLVDDDRINRVLLNAILKEGYEVLQASDGKEAAKIFREQPDLVLMDVMMPVMDGYEATRIIKAESADRFVPVIFLTAVTDEQALAVRRMWRRRLSYKAIQSGHSEGEDRCDAAIRRSTRR